MAKVYNAAALKDLVRSEKIRVRECKLQKDRKMLLWRDSIKEEWGVLKIAVT